MSRITCFRTCHYSSSDTIFESMENEPLIVQSQQGSKYIYSIVITDQMSAFTNVQEENTVRCTHLSRYSLLFNHVSVANFGFRLPLPAQMALAAFCAQTSPVNFTNCRNGYAKDLLVPLLTQGSSCSMAPYLPPRFFVPAIRWCTV